MEEGSDHIDSEEIDSTFAENTEPYDAKLGELLRSAYDKEIFCQKAKVPLNMIRPFSEFRPDYFPGYEEFFNKKISELEPPQLLVYQEGKEFVMSDDYHAFFAYHAIQAPFALCCVIGPFVQSESIELVGEPFYLDPPELEIVE